MSKFLFGLSIVFFVGSSICHAQVSLDSYAVFEMNLTYELASAVIPVFEKHCIESYGEGSVFNAHPLFSHKEFDENTQSYIDYYDVAAYCNGCKGSFFEENRYSHYGYPNDDYDCKK